MFPKNKREKNMETTIEETTVIKEVFIIRRFKATPHANLPVNSPPTMATLRVPRMPSN